MSQPGLTRGTPGTSQPQAGDWVQYLKLGDWALRRVRLSTKESAALTFNKRWEGPYKVVKVDNPGTYRLMDTNEYRLPRLWNIEHLCYYHL